MNLMISLTHTYLSYTTALDMHGRRNKIVVLVMFKNNSRFENSLQ